MRACPEHVRRTRQALVKMEKKMDILKDPRHVHFPSKIAGKNKNPKKIPVRLGPDSGPCPWSNKAI